MVDGINCNLLGSSPKETLEHIEYLVRERKLRIGEVLIEFKAFLLVLPVRKSFHQT